LGSSSGLAQTTSNIQEDSFESNEQKLDNMKKLYDPNCHSFIKSKEYIGIGNSRPAGFSKKSLSEKKLYEKSLYIDSEQQTNRWVNWERINKKTKKPSKGGLTFDYLALIKSADVKKAADKRYRDWVFGREQPDLTRCEDSPTNRNDCLAFKVYCTEQVASRGIEEAALKLDARTSFCMEYHYGSLDGETNQTRLAIAAKRKKLYPNGCKFLDIQSTIPFVQNQANQVVAVANKLKNARPNVKRYFEEIGDTFGKHIGNLKSLDAAQEYARELKERQDIDDAKALVLKQAIKNCQDIVNKDGNDIQGHNIAAILGNNITCHSPEEVQTLEDDSIAKLTKDIEKMQNKVTSNQLDKAVNRAALKKTAIAIWVAYEMMADKENEKDLANDPVFAINELICNYGRKSKHFNPKLTEAAIKML
jgi:hypothetical protein